MSDADTYTHTLSNVIGDSQANGRHFEGRPTEYEVIEEPAAEASA